MDIGNLEAGGREVGVAVVPMLSGELGQGWGGKVNRIGGEVGVGDVALFAMDGEAT